MFLLLFSFRKVFNIMLINVTVMLVFFRHIRIKKSIFMITWKRFNAEYVSIFRTLFYTLHLSPSLSLSGIRWMGPLQWTHCQNTHWLVCVFMCMGVWAFRKLEWTSWDLLGLKVLNFRRRFDDLLICLHWKILENLRISWLKIFWI